MKVFDLGKNLPIEDSWRDLLLGPLLFDQLKAAAKPTEEPVSALGGIRIIVEPSPMARRSKALTLCLMEGRPVAFEDEDRNLAVMEMPKPGSAFPEMPLSVAGMYEKWMPRMLQAERARQALPVAKEEP